jgi:hypothetical protein
MPVNNVKSNSSGDSKLRSELILLQRKYNRLEQKEKRIQVNSSFKSFLKFLINLFFLAIMSRMGKQS